MSPGDLTVLESYRQPRPTTNPYIVQLDSALRTTAGLRVLRFDYRAALLGRYDVFHVHWPENLVGGHRRLGRLARRLAAFLFLLRLTVSRTPVVRTVHNLHRPTGISWWDHRVLDWIERLTRVHIRLNDLTDVPGARRIETVAHGHYRDWFASFERRTPQPGRFAFVGLIRRYKGVEDLVDAFADIDDPSVSLRIAGRPSGPELTRHLTEAAEHDPRLSVRLEFLSEADFAGEITAASIIVLPYLHMHNSGALLAALSLDRPVLVPDTHVNRRLGEEAGPGWVRLFSPPLTAATLLEHARPEVTGSPRLDRRSWSDIGNRHLEAFRAARLRAPLSRPSGR